MRVGVAGVGRNGQRGRACASIEGARIAMFDCDAIRKDLRMMIAEGTELGIDLPLAQRTLTIYDQASREGWGGRDCAELPAYRSSRRGRGETP